MRITDNNQNSWISSKWNETDWWKRKEENRRRKCKMKLEEVKKKIRRLFKKKIVFMY
ncbi:hypothetical protein HYD90_02335 [Mycoplasmopsis bovis]|nr:hypothetical protein HYD90_02335 [Mycoplasmopsis bovis]